MIQRPFSALVSTGSLEEDLLCVNKVIRKVSLTTYIMRDISNFICIQYYNVLTTSIYDPGPRR
jgi:hypothetical protein